MTFEGRMLRGQINYEAGKFLDNTETLAYVASLESTDVNYSGMTKRSMVGECAKQDIELTGDETKDDLIVLLENKSDGVA